MSKELQRPSPWHGPAKSAGDSMSLSRCLPLAARRWGPMKTSVAVGMVVFVLFSTIDGSFATTTTRTTRTASTSGSHALTTDHHPKGWGIANAFPKGWNIAKAFRGGSMTTVQQQQEQPPPPPPPRHGGSYDDRDRRYQESLQKMQLQEKHPHQLQLHRQQQDNWHQQQQQYENYHSRDNHSSRGVHNDLSSVLPKKIDLKQVTKVLLHTSETNRKLHQGVSHWERKKRLQLVTTTTPPSSLTLGYPQPPQGRNYDHRQPYGVYGSLPVNVHPSRTWQPSIREFSGRTFEDEELTLFHAKIPRSRSSSGEAGNTTAVDTGNGNRTDTEPSDGDAEQLGAGARYWGPDLLPYLEHILHELLGVEKEGSEILLFLTMIYLDRACSVETPRTGHLHHGVGPVPPCPFCAPRTVHRLSLSALVVATKAFRRTHHTHDNGDIDAALLSKLSRSLGIPLVQLRQMVEWMLLALGDDGLYVSMEELRAWSRSWDSFFPPEPQG